VRVRRWALDRFRARLRWLRALNAARALLTIERAETAPGARFSMERAVNSKISIMRASCVMVTRDLAEAQYCHAAIYQHCEWFVHAEARGSVQGGLARALRGKAVK